VQLLHVQQLTFGALCQEGWTFFYLYTDKINRIIWHFPRILNTKVKTVTEKQSEKRHCSQVTNSYNKRVSEVMKLPSHFCISYEFSQQFEIRFLDEHILF